MQFALDLTPPFNAQKPLEIEPFNERREAYSLWERFERARELNRAVHAVRREKTGMALAYGKGRG